MGHKSWPWPGVTTVEAANGFMRDLYLPAHDARFSLKAVQPRFPSLSRSTGVDLNEILSFQEEPQVGNDNTVAFHRLRLQIPPSPLRPRFVVDGDRNPPDSADDRKPGGELAANKKGASLLPENFFDFQDASARCAGARDPVPAPSLLTEQSPPRGSRHRTPADPRRPQHLSKPRSASGNTAVALTRSSTARNVLGAAMPLAC